ncbi:2-amino-4-hydroxy-6-hydroxymethyldihydropteridine diphosphokinase [Chromatium weissei]|nr:2-amino-4-hydroxy-6-hydroxymethyldihydropteridine diphosphokinase [Chromatium weissei]
MPVAPSIRAYLAIGSNIDAERNISRCLNLLQQLPRCWNWHISHWYLTRPWGMTEQANFINLVAGVTTHLSALVLFAEMQQIELNLERVRKEKNGPRTIDLDLLLFGDAVLNTPTLQIPHLGLTQRDFMLLPLLEIAPEVQHPVLQIPLNTLAEKVIYRQIIRRCDV